MKRNHGFKQIKRVAEANRKQAKHGVTSITPFNLTDMPFLNQAKRYKKMNFFINNRKGLK